MFMPNSPSPPSPKGRLAQSALPHSTRPGILSQPFVAERGNSQTAVLACPGEKGPRGNADPTAEMLVS